MILTLHASVACSGHPTLNVLALQKLLPSLLVMMMIQQYHYCFINRDRAARAPVIAGYNASGKEQIMEIVLTFMALLFVF